MKKKEFRELIEKAKDDLLCSFVLFSNPHCDAESLALELINENPQLELAEVCAKCVALCETFSIGSHADTFIKLVPPPLFAEFEKRGYKGSPSVEQIIEWVLQEKGLFIETSLVPLCEKRADGTERDRAYGYRVKVEICGWRECAGYYDEICDTRYEANIKALEYCTEYLF